MNEVLDDIAKKVDNGSKYAKKALVCSTLIFLILIYYFNLLFIDLKVNNLEPPSIYLGVLMRILFFLNFIFVILSIYKRETPKWMKWIALFSFLIIIAVAYAPFLVLYFSGSF